MITFLLANALPACAIPPPPDTVEKPAPKPQSRTDVYLVKVNEEGLVFETTVSLDENYRLHGNHPRLEALNKVEGFTVQVVPPDGEDGKWGQEITRGSEWFSDHQRAVLAGEGLFIVPTTVATQKHPMVHTQKRFSLISSGLTTTGDDFTLSGPPGGPLGLSIHPYGDVKAEDHAKWIEDKHGERSDFVMGKAFEAQVGGRSFQAQSYSTGKSLATTTHVVVFWPDIPRGQGSSITSGLVVEFFSGAEDGPSVLEHPSILLAAGSLVVYPDP